MMRKVNNLSICFQRISSDLYFVGVVIALQEGRELDKDCMREMIQWSVVNGW